MAKEYIEREAAIIGLAASSLTPHQIDDAAEAIKLVPAADVVERKTATWLFPHLEPDDITGHVYAECSNCHKVRIVDDFCPACGSRMVE